MCAYDRHEKVLQNNLLHLFLRIFSLHFKQFWSILQSKIMYMNLNYEIMDHLKSLYNLYIQSWLKRFIMFDTCNVKIYLNTIDASRQGLNRVSSPMAKKKKPVKCHETWAWSCKKQCNAITKGLAFYMV